MGCCCCWDPLGVVEVLEVVLGLINVVVVESDVNGGVMGVEICCKLAFKTPAVGLECS